MLTAAHETTKRTKELTATDDGALRVDPSGSRYQDLGLVVDATNVAAGAYAWSPFHSNVQWVRSLVYMVRCDQQYRVVVAAKDTSGTASSDANFDSLTGSIASSGAVLRLHRAGPNAAGTQAPGFLGYSVKFGIKNEAASQASVVQLRMQLLGG